MDKSILINEAWKKFAKRMQELQIRVSSIIREFDETSGDKKMEDLRKGIDEL